jgi:hypothetical protein
MKTTERTVAISDIPVVVKDLSQLLSTCDTRAGYDKIFFSDQVIYKGKNRFTLSEIINSYHLLQQSGISVGPEPWIVIDQKGLWVEASQRVPGLNAADILPNVSPEEAIDFLKNTELENIMKLWLTQGKSARLEYSFDNIPHNYIYDSHQKKFTYIDYEPIFLREAHQHLLYVTNLCNYTLIKFLRERPDLFPEALTLIETYLEKMGQNDSYLGEQLYIRFLYSLSIGKENKARFYLHQITSPEASRDTVLGMMCAVIYASQKPFPEMYKQAQEIGQTLRHTNYNEYIVQIIKIGEEQIQKNRF